MNGDGWTKLVWDKSSDFLKSMDNSGDEPHLGLLQRNDADRKIPYYVGNPQTNEWQFKL